MLKKITPKIVKYIIHSIIIINLMILIIMMMINVHRLQGSGKIINYAGKVRGGTQRLVKLELMNQPNDELIENIDTIINDLIYGGGKNNLILLKDAEFVLNIKNQEMEWIQLKED